MMITMVGGIGVLGRNSNRLERGDIIKVLKAQLQGLAVTMPCWGFQSHHAKTKMS